MKEDQYWLLCIAVTGILRPDIELQTILRYRVVVLGCKVLPHTQTGWLCQVGEGGHWRLDSRAVTKESLEVSSMSCVPYVRRL